MQIKANGITLEYQEFGPKDGTPLILIRGLGTQLVHWPQEFMQGFAYLGYRTIIFDNRDVGLSQHFPTEGVADTAEDITAAFERGEAPKAAYSLADMALDAIGLLDALAIEKAHVFGISMGGAIAHLLALNHADRLLSDTIVMTAAGLKDPSLLPRVLAHPETREQAQENWLQGHRDWGSPGYPMPDDDIRAEAITAWDRDHSAEGINRQAIATFSAPDRREALKSVTLPCFVIHGAVDTLIPPEAGQDIASLIPGAKLKIVEGMGHVITPLLAPVIVEMVNEFIQQNS